MQAENSNHVQGLQSQWQQTAMTLRQLQIIGVRTQLLLPAQRHPDQLMTTGRRMRLLQSCAEKLIDNELQVSPYREQHHQVVLATGFTTNCTKLQRTAVADR